MPPKKDEAALIFAKQFGANLRKARKGRGVSLSELSRRSGFHRTAVCMWESGRRAPMLETFVGLMRALDASADELLEGLDAVPPARRRAPSPACMPAWPRP